MMANFNSERNHSTECKPSIFHKTLTNLNTLDCIAYRLWDMVSNVTFNNISVILWQSVLLVEETRVP